MTEYKRDKVRTIFEIVRRIANWPTAISLRLFRWRQGLRLLAFRNGVNVVCRGATRDWDVIHELFFAGGYGRAMEFLRAQPASPIVLDLGGNIGLFSLLAASTHSRARLIAFEPGPPNHRIFEINRLANSSLSDRIELRRLAVGGEARKTEWAFDEQNPGGSGLHSSGTQRYPIEVVTFSEVVRSIGERVALAKIDIEGAEYELLAQTSIETWELIDAVSLELHHDPAKMVSQDDFLKTLRGFGYRIEQESVCSYFLVR